MARIDNKKNIKKKKGSNKKVKEKKVDIVNDNKNKTIITKIIINKKIINH